MICKTMRKVVVNSVTLKYLYSYMFFFFDLPVLAAEDNPALGVGQNLAVLLGPCLADLVASCPVVPGLQAGGTQILLAEGRLVVGVGQLLNQILKR